MSIRFEARRVILTHILHEAIKAVDPVALMLKQIQLSQSPPVVAAPSVGAATCAPQTGMQAIDFGSLTIHPEQVGRIVVIGTGKASAAMAAGLEEALKGLGASGALLFGKLEGLVNVPDGIVSTCSRIKIVNVRPQGKNAVTDRVLAATQRQVDLIRELGANDILIDLISGGGSATRELLCDGLTLEHLEVVRLALASATIQELNAVRKCCSQVKGGKMNGLTKAGNVLAWVLSDVVGDPLDFIASGPWAESTTSPGCAYKILQHYGVTSGAVYDHILNLSHQRWEPIVPGNNVRQEVIGNNAVALAALHAELGKLGYAVLAHDSENIGDARAVGTALVAPGEVQVASEIYGGETTVTLPKQRNPQFKGGRNQTIVLAALAALWNAGLGDRTVFSIGTDGEDGPTDAAGALIDQGILDAAKADGITLDEVQQALNDGNEYQLLQRMGALVVTGPTGTNVCDLWGYVTMA